MSPTWLRQGQIRFREKDLMELNGSNKHTRNTRYVWIYISAFVELCSRFRILTIVQYLSGTGTVSL
jgi:hypothetical protein